MTTPQRLIACAAIVVAGCSGPDDGGMNATGAQANKASTSVGGNRAAQPGEPSPPPPALEGTFVALERCNVQIGVSCTGYWVREVNTTVERLVALDVSQLGDDATQQADGGGNTLVFRGQLGPIEERTDMPTFVVLEAWRGLPDVATAPGLTVAVVEGRDDALWAMPVNGTAGLPIEAVSVSGVGPWLVDPAWLTSRVLAHGALVAGELQGATLHASQVFVHLPDAPGPCEDVRLDCGNGEAPTYVRNGDRCLLPTGCIVPSPCPEYRPVCAPGYTLAEWPSQPKGCPAYACDAAFLSQ
jgi:hypothetical protein